MIMRNLFKFLLLQFAFSLSLTDVPTSAAATHTPPTSAPTHTPPTSAPTAAPTQGPGCPVGWVQSTEGCFLFHHTGIQLTDHKEEDKSQDPLSNWTDLETGTRGM